MTIEVDMYPYDEIRDHAFRNCLINEIRIPEGVTSTPPWKMKKHGSPLTTQATV